MFFLHYRNSQGTGLASTLQRSSLSQPPIRCIADLNHMNHHTFRTLALKIITMIATTVPPTIRLQEYLSILFGLLAVPLTPPTGVRTSPSLSKRRSNTIKKRRMWHCHTLSRIATPASVCFRSSSPQQPNLFANHLPAATWRVCSG